MFQREGAHRPDSLNQVLAGYLALVAGMVNSAGFLIVGSFTSHVTGNVGRFADDLSLGHRSAALLALVMVLTFFLGAFAASVALESSLLRRRAHVYGSLLLVEAGLLLAFYAVSLLLRTDSPRLHDAQALVLCAAMGIQNCLVTRLSGAVVRTTHLTGIVTDLGIESARWFRFWRAQLGARTGLRLVAGDAVPAQPSWAKSALLLTIVAFFVLGSACGALLAVYAVSIAFIVPSVLLVAASFYAFASGTALMKRLVRK
jgi:uncharacterized membrane protein YoaK (UPF0700 family)